MSNDSIIKPGGGKFHDVGVLHSAETHQIVLPEGMSPKEGRLWLQRFEEQQEMVTAVRRVYQAFVLDGAYAFARAIAKVAGFGQQVPTPGMFGPNPPSMIAFDIGQPRPVQVPWGRVIIPGIDGHLDTSITPDMHGFPNFTVTGEVKAKSQAKVNMILEETQRLITDESVFRGKAIRVRYRDDAGDVFEKFSFDYAPTFMHPTVNLEELIFDAQTQQEIEDYIFTPILHAEQVIKLGVPQKRGVLLHGTFGVGKTMVGAALAKACEANGVTFIDLHDARDIHRALHFARRYAPAVVWTEDIDKAIGLDRTSNVDQILNTLDGVDSKAHRIMTVVTSNELSKIHEAVKRPGRFDAIIGIPLPDASAALRLVVQYGRNLIDATPKEMEPVAAEFAGKIPAIIREGVERAKLSAIKRTSGKGTIRLTANDLLVSARSMNKHLEAMKNPETGRVVPVSFTVGGVEHKGEVRETAGAVNGS